MENGRVLLDSRKIKLRYDRIRRAEYKDVLTEKSLLDKPIFIVGMPHSGTSVLVEIFSTHPHVANWTEASEVWDPSWEEGVINEFDRLVPKYKEDVDESDVSRITEAFYRYVKSKGRQRLVNKNPRNTVRINYIKKIFPDAKIIHIYRDGREVVNSITRNMPDNMMEEICDRWVKSLDEVKKQSRDMPESDFYEIKYEALCNLPIEILTEAYRKCELIINDQILRKLPNKLTNFNGKWKEKMNPKYHDLLRTKLESKMLEYGYRW